MRGDGQRIPNAYIRCLLTTGDAARRAGVTTTTIRTSVRNGRLRCGIQTVGGQVFIHLGDVWHFINQRAGEVEPMAAIEQGAEAPPKGDRQNLRDHLWRTYRVTLKTYDHAVASQEGRCAVCDEPPADGKRLHVDHDHETGQVRGLLCGPCNFALGAMRERSDAICRLAAYADYCARLRKGLVP